jgi:hypothetical protein
VVTAAPAARTPRPDIRVVNSIEKPGPTARRELGTAEHRVVTSVLPSVPWRPNLVTPEYLRENAGARVRQICSRVQPHAYGSGV